MDNKIYQSKINDPESFPEIKILLDQLEIKKDTVALLVNNDPEIMNEREMNKLIDSLVRMEHPNLKGKIIILVGRNLHETLSTITEKEMNDLGWFRKCPK